MRENEDARPLHEVGRGRGQEGEHGDAQLPPGTSELTRPVNTPDFVHLECVPTQGSFAADGDARLPKPYTRNRQCWSAKKPDKGGALHHGDAVTDLDGPADGTP